MVLLMVGLRLRQAWIGYPECDQREEARAQCRARHDGFSFSFCLPGALPRPISLRPSSSRAGAE
jgi:hypothetical protein